MQQPKKMSSDRRKLVLVPDVTVGPRKRPRTIAGGRGRAPMVVLSDPEVDRVFRPDMPETCPEHGGYYGLLAVDDKPVCPVEAAELVLTGAVEPLTKVEGSALFKAVWRLVNAADLSAAETIPYYRVAEACEAVHSARLAKRWAAFTEAVEAERATLSKRLAIPILVLASEVAEVLGVSLRTVERMSHDGRLPGTVKVGRDVAFKFAVLDRSMPHGDPIAHLRKRWADEAEHAALAARKNARHTAEMAPEGYDPVVVAL